MAPTFTILLNDLQLAASHGVFEGEARTGNRFSLDLELQYPAPDRPPSALEETIDYGAVFQLVKEGFSVRTPLLETVAMRLIHQLKEQYPQITEATITVRKLTAAIPGLQGAVGVRYHQVFR